MFRASIDLPESVAAGTRRAPLILALAIAPLLLGLALMSPSTALAEGFDTESARAVQALAASGKRAAKVDINGVNGAVVTTDGSLYMWGDNEWGQLGDGTTLGTQTPKRVPGLSNVVDVSLGSRHVGAVTSDGSLYMWGLNLSGQLGDGTTAERHTPQRIDGIGRVKAVFLHGSRDHSAAVTADGSLYTWGSNANGELGDGTTNDALVPRRVPGLSNVVTAAVVWARSAAVTADGGLYVWGETWGGIGDGSDAVMIRTPQRVPGLSDVASVSLEETATAAVTRDGGLWTFGLNYAGELGLGYLGDGIDDYAPVVQPRRVQGVPAVRAVTLSSDCMGIIGTDGSLWTCGGGKFGQLGNGTTDATYVPRRVTAISGLTSISSANCRMAATTQNGSVYTWGDGYHDRFSEPDYRVPADKLSPKLVTLPLADDEALVTFDANGHGVSPDAVVAKKGSRISAPEAPKAIGYTFTGWYLDRACTEPWDFATDAVSGDLRLYAGWTPAVVPEGTVEVYRLYNQWSHEHLYTGDANEGNSLVAQGWTYEGVGWKAPESSTRPIYRLFNTWSKEHLYTTDRNEYDTLSNRGWNGEGVKLYGADSTGVPAYRLNNPWEDGPAGHHYTTEANERATLLKQGYEDEGVAWYGLK